LVLVDGHSKLVGQVTPNIKGKIERGLVSVWYQVQEPICIKPRRRVQNALPGKATNNHPERNQFNPFEEAFDDALMDAFEDTFQDSCEEGFDDAFEDPFEEAFEEPFEDTDEDSCDDAFNDDLDGDSRKSVSKAQAVETFETSRPLRPRRPHINHVHHAEVVEFQQVPTIWLMFVDSLTTLVRFIGGPWVERVGQG
jgi:hypothetical protein